jgi:hypothetical protein
MPAPNVVQKIPKHLGAQPAISLLTLLWLDSQSSLPTKAPVIPCCHTATMVSYNYSSAILATVSVRLSCRHSAIQCSIPLLQGGISALLSYLDFFPAAVQRSAVSTAAAMAARTSVDTIDCALQAMPQLLPLLEFQDHRIVDSAAAALNGIIDAAARYVSGSVCARWLNCMHSSFKLLRDVDVIWYVCLSTHA